MMFGRLIPLSVSCADCSCGNSPDAGALIKTATTKNAANLSKTIRLLIVFPELWGNDHTTTTTINPIVCFNGNSVMPVMGEVGFYVHSYISNHRKYHQVL